MSRTRCPHIIYGCYWLSIKVRPEYHSIFSSALTQRNAQRLFMVIINLDSKQCLSCLHYVSIIWWTATCLLFMRCAYYFPQSSYSIMWSCMHVNLFHERHHLISKTFTLWNAHVARSFCLERLSKWHDWFPKVICLIKRPVMAKSNTNHLKLPGCDCFQGYGLMKNAQNSWVQTSYFNYTSPASLPYLILIMFGITHHIFFLLLLEELLPAVSFNCIYIFIHTTLSLHYKIDLHFSCHSINSLLKVFS